MERTESGNNGIKCWCVDGKKGDKSEKKDKKGKSENMKKKREKRRQTRTRRGVGIPTRCHQCFHVG